MSKSKAAKPTPVPAAESVQEQPEVVLKRSVEEAARLLNVDGAMIYLYDPGSGMLRFARDAGIRNRDARRLIRNLTLPMGVGMFGTAAARGELTVTTDYPNDPSFTHSPVADQIVEIAGMRSMAVAPMHADGTPLGALGVFLNRPEPFQPAQLGLLTALANHAAATISNATLLRQLHESERRYRFLVERAPDVVFEIDDTGHFTFVSDAIEPIAGWLPSDLVGNHFAMAVAPETLAPVAAEWEALVADPTHETAVDFALQHKDGRSVPAEVRASAIVVDGKFAGVHGSTRDISERVRLEEELREKAAELERSEERYRFLVESSPDIVFELDEHANFTFLSATSQIMTGWDPSEVLGKSLLTVVSPATADRVLAVWEAIRSDPTYDRPIDFELARPDGGVIPVEARGVAIMHDGTFAGVHGSVRDVSERVRLENDLRRRSKELARRVEVQRTLSDIARQLTAMRDPAEVLQRALDEAARLLDADGGEMDLVDSEGRGLYLAYSFARTPEAKAGDSPDFTEPDQGIGGRALTEGRVVMTGDYLTDPAFNHLPEADAWIRESRISSVIAAPIIGEKGSLGAILMDAHRKDAWSAEDAEVLGALADQVAVAVTNARLYAQLESSEKRYRHLVENSPDTIWSAKPDGTITYLSETIEHLSGWKPDELVGQHFGVLVHPSSGDRLSEAWSLLIDEGQPERVTRFYLKHRDGHPIPAETTGIAEVADGRTVGAHGAVRDISARERLESDLRDQAADLAASQERANLARELHDSVTQALFSIGLTARSLELLLDTDPGGARAKLAELHELQKDALAEMRSLILELRPKNLDEDGLEEALRSHAASVQGRTGLSITVEADPGLPSRLPNDAAEALYRITQEALHNVIKHANASSARIVLAREGGALRLSVTDDGIGFDPTQTPSGHLGLVGMRQRADLIGARFAVDSRPGDGTVVRVVWPLPPEPTA